MIIYPESNIICIKSIGSDISKSILITNRFGTYSIKKTAKYNAKTLCFEVKLTKREIKKLLKHNPTHLFNMLIYHTTIFGEKVEKLPLFILYE